MQLAAKQAVDRRLEPVKPGVARIIGRTLHAASTDVTDRVGSRSCLVLTPHPDDETLGCAVTLMRRVEAGTPVQVVLVSDGRRFPRDREPAENAVTRAAEFERACSILGIDPTATTQLGFPDGGLGEAGDLLTDAVAEAVRRFRPDDVLATSEHDPHPDHAALGVAARRALSGTGTRLLAYPIWQWTRPGAWFRTVRASPRAEAVRIDGYVERKRQALASYQSQLARPVDTTEAGDTEGLDEAFVANFFGRQELFFRVSTGSPRRSKG